MRIAVIDAAPGALWMGERPLDAGIEDGSPLERADDVGGTSNRNRCPGYERDRRSTLCAVSVSPGFDMKLEAMPRYNDEVHEAIARFGSGKPPATAIAAPRVVESSRSGRSR